MAAISVSTPEVTFSTLIAVALNSAVPAIGSLASMVSRLVSTSSGKLHTMNARPGRRAGSSRTGASTDPRREVIRTISPSSMPHFARSSGHMSSVVPMRSGELKPLDWTPVL